MAIKRIDYYGQFTPTGADMSTAKRFQALAGFASDVSDIALQISASKIQKQQKAKVAESEKLGKAAGFEAAKERNLLELQEQGTREADVFNSAAEAAYIAGTKTDLQNIISEIESAYPNDIKQYQENALAAFNGLTGNMPDYIKGDLELYFDQLNRSASSRVISTQKTEINEANKATFDSYFANQSAHISNLARENNYEDLTLASISLLKEGQKAVEAGIIRPEKFEEMRRNVNDDALLQLQRGQFESLVINGEGDVDTRIAAGEAVIQALKDKKQLQIEDPADPTKKIIASADQKDALIKTLETDLKDFQAFELKKAERAIQVSEFKQIQNFQSAIENVQKPDIDDDQKLVEINRAEMLGQVRPEDASVLRRYVNSTKALNAITSSDFVSDIISRAYDLNASYDMDPDGNNYLKGMQSLEVDILNGRAAGELTAEDESKLRNTLRGLTSSKKSGATASIRDNWSSATRSIQTALSPDLWGVATRQLWDAVNEEKQRIREEENREVTRSEELKLWSNLAQPVISRIQIDRRERALNAINSVATQRVGAGIPVITTQAEYDALPVGAQYKEQPDGQTFIKP